MNVDSQFKYLMPGQNLQTSNEQESDEKDSLFLSPAAVRRESQEEIKSPVRTFKHLDYYTVTYEHSLDENDPANALFPFGSQSQQTPLSQRKIASSRSTSHSKRESNLKRRILTILDEPRSDLFTEYCEKNSIKNFLKSQQALNKDIYFEVLEQEKLDKSAFKNAEKILESEKSLLIETPEEDERISHSFSLSQVRNSQRDLKEKPDVTFESWLAKNKPK